MEANVGDFFVSLERTLKESPRADQLREIRDTLDDPAYVAEMARFIKEINDPDILSDLLTRMRRMRRHIEERCEKRKLHKDLVVQMGVVGGVGLIGGSIVAAASATFPLIALIPVAGGIWMALQGFTSASRLDEERHIYEQLAERMEHILNEVQ